MSAILMTAWNLRIMMNWSPIEFLKASLCLLIGFEDCGGEKKAGEMIDVWNHWCENVMF